MGDGNRSLRVLARAGLPDTSIGTFASRLRDRDPPERYVDQEAYERYLAKNPNNELRSVFPVHEGRWQEIGNEELVDEAAREIVLRKQAIALPRIEEYARRHIGLELNPRVHVFELCRFLAEVARDNVLATRQERRISILPEMEQLLQLEEWHHPDVAAGERPSGSETFQQLAHVLATGDVSRYRPARPPNTDWRNWPEGGSL